MGLLAARGTCKLSVWPTLPRKRGKFSRNAEYGQDLAVMTRLRVRVGTALAVFLVLPACGGAGLRVALPVTSVDRRADAGQGVGFFEQPLSLQLRGGARQGAANAKGERARANATLTPELPPQTAAQSCGQNATHEHADGEVNWEDELPDALRGVPQDEWLQKVDELRAAQVLSSSFARGTRPASVCVWPSLPITSLHLMSISSFPSSMVAGSIHSAQAFLLLACAHTSP